jgi:uncharacterized protein (DUF433 family)
MEDPQTRSIHDEDNPTINPLPDAAHSPCGGQDRAVTAFASPCPCRILFPVPGIVMAEALTVNEAAVLFGLDEGRVRKDVEYGVVGTGSPPRFELAALVYLRALVEFGFDLGIEDRKKLYGLIRNALKSRKTPETIELSPITDLKLGKVVDEVAERVDRFDTWKGKLVTDPNTLGGEPTFPKTRLAVRQVGGMLLRGASAKEIREDYPYLTDSDIEFSKLYTQAHPRVGRPRERQTPSR